MNLYDHQSIMGSANPQRARNHGGFAMRRSSLKNEELSVPEGKLGMAGLRKEWWFAEHSEFAVMAPGVRARRFSAAQSRGAD